MSAARVKKRILMTADAVGGVWSYCMTLTEGLARRGIGTTLAVMGPGPCARQMAQAAAIPGLVLEYRPCKLEWQPGISDEELDAASDWLLQLAADYRPDLVHINGYAHAATPFSAPIVAVAHSCVLSWWRAVKAEEAPPQWNDYARRVMSGLTRADRVIAPSAAFLASLQDHYGNRGKAQVIRNGITIPAGARPKKQPLILGAGRIWDEAKNLSALDHVAAQLPWRVLVAGDDTGPDGAPRPLRHVQALGRLASSDLHDLMRRASIFALPARYEPFGLAVLEAAQSGCALVLGDIPTLRELWQDCALFVPPEDSEALRSALELLIAEPGLRKDYAQRAKDHAKDYAAAPMIDAYCRLYAELGLTPAVAM